MRQGGFPPNPEQRPLTGLELLWIRAIIYLSYPSLCNMFRWIRSPGHDSNAQHCRRGFLDFYALLAGIGIPLWFLVAGWTCRPCWLIALYLTAEMLVSTLRVQFVNVYEASARPHSPSRSVVLLLMGYGTVILTFALFYRASGTIIGTCGQPVRDPLSMLYFSFVTITTVGYGDLHPQPGSLGVWLVCLEIFIGILMIVVLLARFLTLGIENWQREREQR